jgi:hypothetical protein
MVKRPQFLFGQVMHKRLFPQVNGFQYGIYYMALPVSQISPKIENRFFKVNRFGLLSFYNKDHGARENDNPESWVRNILSQHKIDKADGEIILVTMPRVLGYVFNPVSFWFCYDSEECLRAVICEVNNTFGETHSYICCHQDQREITKEDILTGQKVFHVSPFLEREGEYKFRFAVNDKSIGAWIDFFDISGNKKLVTSLTGKLSEFSSKACLKAFWAYPLVTFKAIFLIHWQAVKLFLKRAEYFPKPLQKKVKITRATGQDPKN